MNTYKYGKYESWYCGGFYQFYAIHKKTWYGWKKYLTFDSKEKMDSVVQQLKENGNIITE